MRGQAVAKLGRGDVAIVPHRDAPTADATDGVGRKGADLAGSRVSAGVGQDGVRLASARTSWRKA